MPKTNITYESAWKEYDKGLSYNAQVGLNDTVIDNENFFVGKQWEGVEANGMPTPVFNEIKRMVLFSLASIVSDNLKLHASPLSMADASEGLPPMADSINAEFDAVFERNDIGALVREFARNAAVDGDACLFTYWDADAETGQESKGTIRTEVIENTRVFFGNPRDKRVQKQPYIIISRREMVDEVKDRAEENGCDGWDEITSDSDDINGNTQYLGDDYVTVLSRFWRNKETGTIWCYESTRTGDVRKAWDLGLKLYPITWLCWDYLQDSYHGMALVTGLIPNQIFINKLFAMTMLSLMTSAFPKTIYNKTLIKSWDNRVGAAIPVNSSADMNSVAKILEPAQISPQIAQFIQMAIDTTLSSVGATAAALGDTRPDNTSAIIALQRSATAPLELTKQNLYKAIEDLGRICLDFMGEFYGTRKVRVDIPKEVESAAQFAGIPITQKVAAPFDFSVLKREQIQLKLDVGASSYWSEIASVTTLDNLLMQNKIELADYLERLPDGFVSKKDELIAKYRQPTIQGGQAPQGGAVTETGEPTPIPGGAGYGELQRKVNATGQAS